MVLRVVVGDLVFSRQDDGSVRIERYKIGPSPGDGQPPESVGPVLTLQISATDWASVVTGLAPPIWRKDT